jgi:hypothetical protein
MEKGGAIESQEDVKRNNSVYSQVEITVPRVTWYKHAGLRKLYLMMPILMLGSTINGYDGSLLNGLQTMVPWQDCNSISAVRQRYIKADKTKFSTILLDQDLGFSPPFRTSAVFAPCSFVS